MDRDLGLQMPAKERNGKWMGQKLPDREKILSVVSIGWHRLTARAFSFEFELEKRAIGSKKRNGDVQ